MTHNNKPPIELQALLTNSDRLLAQPPEWFSEYMNTVVALLNQINEKLNHKNGQSVAYTNDALITANAAIKALGPTRHIFLKAVRLGHIPKHHTNTKNNRYKVRYGDVVTWLNSTIVTKY